MKFRPLHDRVVVKPLEQETKTAGGIIIPDTAKEKPMQGEVIAVGPGARGEDGKVTALEVDVVIDSAALDRYEVSGTLVATDAQGVERPVAEAQVTDLLGAGSHTVTLRFEAGHAGLSKLDGSYSLRGLQLYSLVTNTLYHRLGKGLDIRMPAVRASELAAAELTPAIESLRSAGEFDLGQ